MPRSLRYVAGGPAAVGLMFAAHGPECDRRGSGDDLRRHVGAGVFGLAGSAFIFAGLVILGPTPSPGNDPLNNALN